MRGVFDRKLAHLDALLKSQARHINGVILKYENGVKQSATARHLAPFLYLGQRGVLIMPEFGLLRLQISKPVAKRQVAGKIHLHRQRVDKQPQHAIDPGQLGRAPGDNSAENHSFLAAVMMKQYPPDALHQRVESDLVLPRDGLNGAALLNTESRPLFKVSLHLSRSITACFHV